MPTGLVAVAEPALTNVDGVARVAFTALPSADADWRALYLMDLEDDRVRF